MPRRGVTSSCSGDSGRRCRPPGRRRGSGRRGPGRRRLGRTRWRETGCHSDSRGSGTGGVSRPVPMPRTPLSDRIVPQTPSTTGERVPNRGRPCGPDRADVPGPVTRHSNTGRDSPKGPPGVCPVSGDRVGVSRDCPAPARGPREPGGGGVAGVVSGRGLGRAGVAT